MNHTFFTTGRAFRTWLAKHHARETELLLGLYKTDSGIAGITYNDALDEALAFGWIDGVRRRLDDVSYSIRFTPRKARSIWSAVNIKRVNELVETGRMEPSGLAAFAKRDEKRSAIYSYERGGATFDGETLTQFTADKKAWAFYQAQAPWYQRTAAFWATSAKKPETRARRLGILIERPRKGERIETLARPQNPPRPRRSIEAGQPI